MTYTKAIEWLFAQLPMYQNMGKKAYKANLDNTYLLADYLGNPEKKLKCVHVAGTNGKGSTSHMLTSVLQEAGYKVGLYTSPHLKDFRERIKVNGQMIPESLVIDFVEQHQAFFQKNGLSFFEMTVGLAFNYFVAAEVDIAVIEVGLGGRLDSTNIVLPEVSVITNIGLDHTQFLGNSLAEIAREKAGIIKENVPCIIGQKHPETQPVFEEIASVKKATIIYAEEKQNSYESDLKGSYQKENIHTAVTALSCLTSLGWNVSEEHIKEGLLRVIPNTGLQGRWQVLGKNPMIICDTAHNKEGLTYVLAQLNALPKAGLHIVLGAVKDKNLQGILPLFPKDAKYYFCKPNNARGFSATELTKLSGKFGLVGSAYNSVNEAFENAKKQAAAKDVIFVGGSTFVVAEIL